MLEASPTTEFEKFIRKEKILIIDPSRASRVGIARAFSDFGAATTQMTLVDSYAWAEQALASLKPGIVIMDYTIDSRCTLDLLQHETGTERKITAIITHNNSRAAVAHAAEGDVDVFLTKPYTLEAFREAFETAVKNKLAPTEYVKTIDIGKKLIANSELDRALALFEKACALNETPSLAYFYRGHTYTLNKALNQAQESFSKGLEYNGIHYKCLVGLHDALMAQNNLEEAYLVLRRIIHSFPLNPNRFATLLRLAVRTQKYEDLEAYYDSFLEMEIKPEDVVKHTCAALIVAAKRFFKQGQPEKALALCQKAGVSSAGRSLFLKEIILALAENDQAQEIEKYLSRFSPESRTTTEYCALEYLFISKTKPLHVSLEHGRKLLREKHQDPLIYRLLIEASNQAGFMDHAQSLASDALRIWPDKKTEFVHGI